MFTGKTVVRIFAIFTVAIVLLLLAGYLFVYKQRHEILRKGTEAVMTWALKVPVTVKSAKLEVTEGLIEFTEITIANPEGYNSPHAMKFGRVSVKADVQSIWTPEPTLDFIEIQSPDITLDSKITTSNLQKLQENVNSRVEELKKLQEGKSEAETKAAAKKDENQKAYKIKLVKIQKSTLSATIPFSGSAKTYSVPLPDLEAKDIGGSKRMSAAEATQEVLAILLGQISKSGDGILPGDVLGSINKTLAGLPGETMKVVNSVVGDIGKTGGDAVKAVENTAKDLGKSVEDATKGVGDSLGGLLGGGEKKDKKKTEEKK